MLSGAIMETERVVNLKLRFGPIVFGTDGGKNDLKIVNNWLFRAFFINRSQFFEGDSLVFSDVPADFWEKDNGFIIVFRFDDDFS